MIIEDLVKQEANRLVEAGYIHGYREADILLSSILDRDSGTLVMIYEDDADAQTIEKFTEWVDRRIKGEPIAYIVGNQQFMGWKFLTDERALIPRPETELLVELLVREIRERKIEHGNFLEIGTGSGNIAIALKKYFPQASVTATDISAEALELATDNTNRLAVDIELIESDLFETVPAKKYDLIVANLPYVPTQKLMFVSEQILDYEPMIAIEADEDGLKYIRPFLKEAPKYLDENGLIAIEMWHTHGNDVKELATANFGPVETAVLKDLAGFDRYAFISKI